MVTEEKNINEVLEEEPSESQYTLEEIQEFVDSHEPEEDSQEEEDPWADYNEDDEDDDLPSAQDPGKDRIHIDPPKTYEKKQEDYYNNMVIPVQDYNHVITQSDKEAYLDSMMQESELQLTISMKNGLDVTCRDLNMYEREVSLELAKTLLRADGLTPQMAYSILSNIRMPMQIVKCGSKKFNTIRLDYDPDASADKLKQDIQYLEKQYKKILMPIPSFLKALYSKALNIFEHKLARLEEAAFNEDFWNPVERD